MHRIGLAACFAALWTAMAAPVEAQAYRAPRTALGQPSLEGLWSNASITTLERPTGLTTLELADDEARAYEAGHPGTPEATRTGGIGQDTTEWWEMGGKLGRLGGRARSSWIVEPADGKLPYTPAGLAAVQAAQAANLADFSGPEARQAAERCLMGVSGSSLPPMLNAGYNNLMRIVQSRDHVVIVSEMGSGPRIIRLAAGAPEPGPTWNGDSVGRWEGETLVVRSSGFHPGTQWRSPSRLYVSAAAKVTERFTRTGPDQIRYAFEVDDPATYSRAWRAEMPLRSTAGPMFEFACHEGNYSLAGVLAGGREQERGGAPVTRP